MVARQFWVLQVVGSNPAAPTIRIKYLAKSTSPRKSAGEGRGKEIFKRLRAPVWLGPSCRVNGSGKRTCNGKFFADHCPSRVFTICIGKTPSECDAALPCGNLILEPRNSARCDLVSGGKTAGFHLAVKRRPREWDQGEHLLYAQHRPNLSGSRVLFTFVCVDHSPSCPALALRSPCDPTSYTHLRVRQSRKCRTC